MKNKNLDNIFQLHRNFGYSFPNSFQIIEIKCCMFTAQRLSLTFVAQQTHFTLCLDSTVALTHSEKKESRWTITLCSHPHPPTSSPALIPLQPSCNGFLTVLNHHKACCCLTTLYLLFFLPAMFLHKPFPPLFKCHLLRQAFADYSI